MKLSSRTRYGMRAILELAMEYGKSPLQIKAIADREDISNKYLEQLIAMLKAAGLVRSVRGPHGGYTLAKPPAEIRLKEVFLTLEGPIAPVECLQHTDFCPRCTDCGTRQIWQELQNAIMGVLESVTLADLVERSIRSKKVENYTI
ncbi:MAG TPA: Rrf2 family transcriptional regulator [Anaerohalosphaeraceae bacterium]|nr:Rrf2 family transcriptional regulator [Anaerohalosphaeraceae bacterium]HOL31789.1 Rrf2 family transcriptional regulator [Anaerohalosphaeraceae bacterium]